MLTFSRRFSTENLDLTAITDLVEEHTVTLRKRAAAFVRDAFQQNGYYHGYLTTHVQHCQAERYVEITVELVDNGLPMAEQEEACSTT